MHVLDEATCYWELLVPRDGLQISRLSCMEPHEPLQQGPVCAVVWRAQTIGIAFQEMSALRFAQFVDVAPDFATLQLVKFALKPSMFIVPGSELRCTDFVKALQRPELLHVPETNENASLESADDTTDEYPVVACKSRDFTSEASQKRLSLMHGLISNMFGLQITEREALLYFEHILPREQVYALRAIGGLLAYLQKNESAATMAGSITEMKRYEIETQLHLYPETFVALNIFEDARHPSTHGMDSTSCICLYAYFDRMRVAFRGARERRVLSLWPNESHEEQTWRTASSILVLKVRAMNSTTCEYHTLTSDCVW